jgi:RluA family pseudouridine synthase
MESDILYLDNHLLVVNKQPGLLSQGDRTGDDDLLTLAKDFLKQRFDKPGKVYLGLVHRLDRPVSGVMVFARTSKAAARLSAQFRSGAPRKRYLALVEGACSERGICIDHVIKEEQGTRIVAADHPRGQYAELSWTTVAQQNQLSLLDICLKTGRSHQIRLQLAHRGFPILGDRRYGSRRMFDGSNIGLHCYLLEVAHPITQEPIGWAAGPPATWQGYFDRAIADIIRSASSHADSSSI